MSGRVVFDGWYGMRNAGDDAFCVVAAAIARARWGVTDLAFVAPKSRLPVLPEVARGVFPERVWFRGHGRLAPLPAMLRAGRVVHVGGSTFQSMDRRRHRDEQRLARLGLLSLYAVGVSVGPFPSGGDGERVVEFLRLFRRLHVRDTASAQRVLAIDPGLVPRIGFDVAVLLPELEFCRDALRGADRDSSGEPPMLGISVCRDATFRGAPSVAEAQRQSAIVELLRNLAAGRPVRYRFIVFNSHPRWGDERLTRTIADAVADRARIEVIPYRGDVRETLAAVAGCDALLGTRLHSGIFAYACGVPFALVAYHQKGRDLAHEIELPERFLFPVHGPDPARDIDTMAELLEEGRGMLTRMLPLATARGRARAGFEELEA